MSYFSVGATLKAEWSTRARALTPRHGPIRHMVIPHVSLTPQNVTGEQSVLAARTRCTYITESAEENAPQGWSQLGPPRPAASALKAHTFAMHRARPQAGDPTPLNRQACDLVIVEDVGVASKYVA